MDGVYLRPDRRPQPRVQPVTAPTVQKVSAGPIIRPVRLTDGVLSAIETRLAGVPPERGGALLASGGLLHLLIEDTSGSYSGASWDISKDLSVTVGELEIAGHGQLAGTVHTHPAGIPDPSGPDIATTRDALDLNPHMSQLLIAVVTEGQPRPSDLPVGSRHKMALHLLHRNHAGHESLVRLVGEVVPLAADLTAAGVSLTSAISIAEWRKSPTGRRARDLPTVITMNHSPRLAVAVPASRPAALLIDPAYPHAGPVAVTATVTEEGAVDLRPLSSPWDPVSAASPQLAALVRAAAGTRIQDATSRVWPLLGELASRRVLVAGAGSVGSRISEDLVRAGVGFLTLIDPDQVEAVNLSRTAYSAADIGSPKTAALARRLRAIDPAADITCHDSPLGLVDLEQALHGVSLVVAATDDMGEQALLAHHAYALGVPLVACALYKEGAAGEVVISMPAADTACWSCAVGAGTAAEAYRPQRDYGLGGRLAGESALGPSIQLVTAVAACVALGLLAGPDSPAGTHITRLLAERRTLGLISTTPSWDFFGKVFAGMDHQHAPQSVWARVEQSPTCAVCGQQRIRPMSPLAGAQLADTINQLRTDISGERDVRGSELE